MLFDYTGRPVNVEPIPEASGDPFRRRLGEGALLVGLRREQEAAMCHMVANIDRAMWDGGTLPVRPPDSRAVLARRWVRRRWRALREAVARGALWVLRAPASDLCEDEH